MALSLDV